MEQNNSKNININDWVNLPEVVIRALSVYFKQNDLIELSKVCVYYRNQLRSQVLRSINIPHIDEKCSVIDVGLFTPEKMIETIINCLSHDFKGSHHLVKELTLRSDYSNQFISYLFTVFQKISSITFYRSRDYNLNELIQILSNSNCLQHITYKSRFAKFNPLESSIDYNFLYKLKSINLRVLALADKISPFDIIDSSYSNLRSLSITSNHMLTKLCNEFPSLRYVEFEACAFKKPQFLKFIRNNPQLQKLSISADDLDESIINSILVLEKLYLLEINDNILSDDYEYNFTSENYSIKHFKYNGCGINRNITRIIKKCKSLEVFELYDIMLINTLRKIIEEKFPEVNTLLIHRSFKISEIMSLILNLTKFKQVKFRNCCRFEDLYETCKDIESFNWVPKYDYTKDTDEFTLLRKSI